MVTTYINNKDITIFNAKLCERTIGIATVNNTSLWENNFLEPINYTGKYKFKPIKLSFDINCTDNGTLEIMKSKLLKELLQCIIKFSDIANINYRCIQNANVEIEDVAIGNQIVTINMYGIAEEDEVAVSLSDTTSKTITVGGTSITPCKLVLSFSSATTLTITGLSKQPITITGVTGTVIVDGSKCVVTEDNINIFAKTNIKEFPYLSDGNNTITFSVPVSGTIVYKPRYI